MTHTKTAKLTSRIIAAVALLGAVAGVQVAHAADVGTSDVAASAQRDGGAFPEGSRLGKRDPFLDGARATESVGQEIAGLRYRDRDPWYDGAHAAEASTVAELRYRERDPWYDGAHAAETSTVARITNRDGYVDDSHSNHPVDDGAAAVA